MHFVSQTLLNIVYISIDVRARLSGSMTLQLGVGVSATAIDVWTIAEAGSKRHDW